MNDKFNSNDPSKKSKRLVKKKKTQTVVARASVSYATPELEELFAKMYAMKDDLDAKLNKVGELVGMSTKEISSYLNNPNNFSPAQWEKMQADRKKVEQQLYLGMGQEVKEKKAKKVLEKKAKERRGKMIGSRKKWLQM
jgi:hypothetical protein